MASTLDRTGESRPNVGRGHGTEALGPSDSSDTGSDIVGGPGLKEVEPLDLGRGTTSHPNRSGNTAGPDIGDSDLDSDSDAAGTGENITAGRDPLDTNQDREPNRIDYYPELSEEPAESLDEIEHERTGPDIARGGEDGVPSMDHPPPLRKGDIPVADRDVEPPPPSDMDARREI